MDGVVKQELYLYANSKMMKTICTILLGFVYSFATAQYPNFILSSDGNPALHRKSLVDNCLKAMNKTRTDAASLALCECRAEKLNRFFSDEDYRDFSDKKGIDISAMIASNTIMTKRMEDCFTSSGKTILLQAEFNEKMFVQECIKSVQTGTGKQLDSLRLKDFCTCQMLLVKQKQLTDADMETLSNPNSVLFYEVMYKCGNPFAENPVQEKNWTNQMAGDVEGPPVDTVKVLTMNGMTYVKIKTGSLIQFWLFDTGASDMLINKEMEAHLKKEGLLTEKDFLGTGEYEMANGTIDTCRRYTISGLQIGKSHVNNVIVAVSDKSRRIIAGKALLNKFTRWMLDNSTNLLELTR